MVSTVFSTFRASGGKNLMTRRSKPGAYRSADPGGRPGNNDRRRTTTAQGDHESERELEFHHRLQRDSFASLLREIAPSASETKLNLAVARGSRRSPDDAPGNRYSMANDTLTEADTAIWPTEKVSPAMSALPPELARFCTTFCACEL